MGDKSPQAKQREKNQKTSQKAQTKTDSAKRQAGFSADKAVEKPKKK